MLASFCFARVHRVTGDDGKPAWEVRQQPSKPAFQKSAGSESSGGAVSTEQVHRVASSVLGVDAEKANVHAVASFEELPDAVRKASEAEGVGPGDIDAVYYDGHSYILADMMADADAVRAAVFHELYTHRGLRAKYENRLNDKLEELARGPGGLDGIRRMAKKQGINLIWLANEPL